MKVWLTNWLAPTGPVMVITLTVFAISSYCFIHCLGWLPWFILVGFNTMMTLIVIKFLRSRQKF